MKDFDELIEQLRENSLNEYNAIPHSFVKRYKDILPGVMKSCYTLITASSGIGKSKYARNTYIYDVIKFLQNQPDKSKFKVKIFFFSLEESSLKVSLSFIARRLQQKYGLEYTTRELLSIVRKEKDGIKKVVDETLLKKIQEFRDEYNALSEYLEVIDHIHHGYGIYKYVEKWLHANGKIEEDNDADGNKIIKSYVPNHPNQYCIVLTDQLNLLSASAKEQTLWQAMLSYSSIYSIRLRNRYGCSIINIQQQEAAKEKQVYTSDGSSVETKLEPSLDSLGDNKLTQRDADIVLGVFAPHRYGIKSYPSGVPVPYDITLMKDSFRSIIKLKDRDDYAPVRMSFKFNGAAETFEELPKPEEVNKNRELFKYVQQ